MGGCKNSQAYQRKNRYIAQNDHPTESPDKVIDCEILQNQDKQQKQGAGIQKPYRQKGCHPDHFHCQKGENQGSQGNDKLVKRRQKELQKLFEKDKNPYSH